MNPAPTASSVSDHGVWDIPTALGGYFLSLCGLEAFVESLVLSVSED